MKKHVHKSRKAQAKRQNIIIIGCAVITVLLIVALIVARFVTPANTDYIITADGHVHTADGAHVGDAAEMFGEGYTVTADGHVHAADGTHVGTADTLPEATEAPAEAE